MGVSRLLQKVVQLKGQNHSVAYAHLAMLYKTPVSTAKIIPPLTQYGQFFQRMELLVTDNILTRRIFVFTDDRTDSQADQIYNDCV